MNGGLRIRRGERDVMNTCWEYIERKQILVFNFIVGKSAPRALIAVTTKRGYVSSGMRGSKTTTSNLFPALIHIRHLHIGLSKFALALVRLGFLVLAFKDGLAVLVELKLRDDTLGGMNSDLYSGPGLLLPCDAVNVNDPLFSVALDDLTLASLVGSPDNRNLVVLSDGHGAYVVLFS